MKKIVVYGKPSCPQCVEAKNTLTLKNIPFIYVDVTKDQDAYDMLIKENFKSVPQIFVDGMSYGSLKNLSKLVENYR